MTKAILKTQTQGFFKGREMAGINLVQFKKKNQENNPTTKKEHYMLT